MTRTRNPRSEPGELEVGIRPWAEGDLELGLMGDPAMTEHLDGSESDEKIRSRHERYCAIAGTGRGRMFVIVVGPQAEPAGSVGYWESTWRGETTWETGWSVLSAFQGRGVAKRGAALAIERAREEGTHRFIHAYPTVDNRASNAVCAGLGFEIVETADFEYSKGTWELSNNWRLELSV